MSASDDGSGAIESLRRLDNIERPNAGQIILLTILLPIVEIGVQAARSVGVIADFFLVPIEEFIRGVGMLIISILGGAAGIIDAAVFASSQGFREGVFSTLGPLVFPLGIVTVGAGAWVLAQILETPGTSDSITGLFSGTNVPVLGAEEEESDQ